MTKFTEAERAGLAQLKEQIQNCQRSEHPKMSLLEQAENIRARVKATAEHNDQAMKLVIADRDKGLLVTRLGMRMAVGNNSEREIINLGLVAGIGGDEHGTVSISYLMIKRDELGKLVVTQQIKAKILRGGEVSIRKDVDYFGEQQGESRGYSVIYPRPDQTESERDAIVANEEGAKRLLQKIGFAVNRCLTRPNLSFHRLRVSVGGESSRINPTLSSLMDRVGR